MKIRYYILLLIIVVVSILCFRHNYYVGYHLIDSIEVQEKKSIEGTTICSKTNHEYMAYNLAQYDVDFGKNCILITSYKVKKIKRRGDFVRIWVKDKT